MPRTRAREVISGVEPSKPTVAPDARRPSAAPAGRGFRALVVEDNPLNAKLLRDVLGASGYEVRETTTGEAGIDLARRERPDVILMDIQLPGMDGVTALRALKKDPRTRAIPVIAVTASAMPQERSHILAAGFDGYQAKPISVRALLTEIAALLAVRGARDE